MASRSTLMALGATAPGIGRVVLGRALVLAMIGVLIGAVLARALTRCMESLLLEVKATDPLVFAGAIAGVVVCAVLAACSPAWQAVRVDPVKSLRS